MRQDCTGQITLCQAGLNTVPEQPYPKRQYLSVLRAAVPKGVKSGTPGAQHWTRPWLAQTLQISRSQFC